MKRKLQHVDWRWRMDCQLAMLCDSLAGVRSVLDVGCGQGSPLVEIPGIRKFGVDGYEPSVNAAIASGCYEQVECADLFVYLSGLETGAFEATVALDVIEHFERTEGMELLQQMERVASRVVIVATPNGFLAQPADSNPYQEHRSGWDPPDFLKRGYEIQGLYGVKILRGAGHELRGRSSALLARASWASQGFAKDHPSTATALFCRKKISFSDKRGTEMGT